MEFQLNILNPKRRCCESDALNMPENLENSAAATGLRKFSFHFISKQGRCQRTFKLPHNCTHFTCQQSNAQNPSSQASTVCEPRTSRCTNWIQKRQKNHRSNCQNPLYHRKAREFQKTSTYASLTTLKPLCGSQQTVENS